MVYYSDGISISLGLETPGWIRLTSNRTLLLDTTNNLFPIEKITNFTIILKDSTNAFSKYNLTVDIEPLIVPLFPKATKHYLNWSEAISIPIDIKSQYDVNIINWNRNTAIKTLSYNKTTSLLYIRFMSAKSWKSVWVRFISQDSWNKNTEGMKKKKYLQLIKNCQFYIP